MPPFDETVNLQAVDTGTGGPSALMSVADRLESFETLGQQTVSYAAQLKQQGIELDQAHLKAQRDAYFAGFETDARETIGRLKNQYSDDLIKYNEAVEGYVQGLKSKKNGVPIQYQEEALQTVRDFAVTGRLSVQANQISRQKQEATDTMMTALDSASMSSARANAEGDSETSGFEQLKVRILSAQMVENGQMSEDDAAKYVRESERESTEQGFRARLDTQTIEEATESINEWSKEVPKGWTPDEWKTFIKSARTDVGHRKTELSAENARLSDATEEEWFAKAVNGTLTETDILTGYVDDPAKRSNALSLMHRLSDRAISAENAKKALQKSEAEYTFTLQQRAKTEAIKAGQEEFDTLLNEGNLDLAYIQESDAPESVKKDYRVLLEKQEKEALEFWEELQVEAAEQDIINNLGGWTDKELMAFTERGLTPSRVFYWQQQNQEVIDDPNNYKNGMNYKQGLADLSKDKENYLFLGGETAKNQTQRNINFVRYQKISKEYERRSATEDPIEVLNELKQPFLAEEERNALDKISTFIKQKAGFAGETEFQRVTRELDTSTTAPIDYTTLTNEELEDLL